MKFDTSGFLAGYINGIEHRLWHMLVKDRTDIAYDDSIAPNFLYH